MKDKIPTTEFTHGEYKATLYNWLTQSEDDAAQAILTGDQEFAVGNTDGDKVTVTTTLVKLNEYRNFRLKALLKTPDYSEVDAWSPDAREALVDEVSKIVDKKKPSKN